MALRDELKPHDTVASTSCLAAKLRESAEIEAQTKAFLKKKGRVTVLDSTFSENGGASPEGAKINIVSRAKHGLPSHIPRAKA